MPSLTTHDDLQKARSLGLCYLCGRPFAEGERRSRDHVPPRTVFATAHREPALVLPTHRKCNVGQSQRDEVIGQLVALLHGKAPRAERLRLAFDLFSVDGNPAPLAGLREIPVGPIIWRWVRGFHAALYGESLPDCGGYIFPPFPTSTARGRRFVPDREAGRVTLTDAFKQHRHIGRTDQIVCNGSQCEYGCVWLKMDDGRLFCLFGLRLYNWQDLGDQRFGKRGCIGYYQCAIPPGATVGTELEIPVRNFSPLDPFEFPSD